MIAAKKHCFQEKIVLAIADKNILGKKYSEKGLQLDLSSGFYKGKEKPEKEIEKMIDEADMLNVVGKESIEFCIKKRLVDKKNIIKIKGIPHTQIILLKE
ncbi:DUF424 family protein [Candidatus Woesearchaeota archaeon]|nr:DUF424 family protein [Candidatus Woesearchaeota archaeon]